MKSADHLIIGHGIAGGILADRFIKLGKTVQVIDSSEKNNSSVIAAGLYNPVTGRKMVKTWMADQLFPNITDFYTGLESRLGSKFHFPITIYRPFFSIEEYNDWMGRTTDPKFSPYINEVSGKSIKNDLCIDPFGGIKLNFSGYVDVQALVNASKNKLKVLQAYTEDHFDETELQIATDEVIYKGARFKSVIYCSGFHTKNSKYFGWLPFSPVKGEILTVSHKGNLDLIINRGVFIIPIRKGVARIGATYDHNIDDTTPSVKAKTYLEEKVAAISSLDYEIMDHKTGIRPATKDRRPFLGKHPSVSNLFIFNGFGSKGVSLIPTLAKQMTDYIENGTKISIDIDINRYLSLLE